MRFWFPICLLFAGFRLSADVFSIRTVDGLGRPISDVQVDVSCMSPNPKALPLNFISDRDGMVHGEYDAALCKPQSTSVEKPGYATYSTGFRDRYVLERQFGAQDLDRIVNLTDDDRLREFREFLAGNGRQFPESVFYYEARLRPLLRTLVLEPEVTMVARDLLALIAVPDDIHLLLHLPPPPESYAFEERWRYRVATALVDPDDEEEWLFLQRCALK
jgi:hypothetical protein